MDNMQDAWEYYLSKNNFNNENNIPYNIGGTVLLGNGYIKEAREWSEFALNHRN